MPTRLRRRALLAASLALPTLAPCGASAEGDPWPTRTVRLIIPSAAGGAADFVGRTLGRFLEPRLGQPQVRAAACVPGSRGWVGDHCFADADCASGTSCRGAQAGRPGVCSMSCERLCADQPGYADTFCAAIPALGAGGSCVRQCTPAVNAPECPADLACAVVGRNGQASVTRAVCVPRP